VDELNVNFPELGSGRDTSSTELATFVPHRDDACIETRRIGQPRYRHRGIRSSRAEAVAEIPGYSNNYPKLVMKDIYESSRRYFMKK
jgi:hypothetical protein